MGKWIRVVAVLAAILAGAASASAPKSHEVDRSRTIAAPFDRVWSSVVKLFAERNWSIKTIDKSSGVIATDWLRISDEYADCGSAPLATKRGTRVTFNVLVAPAGETATDVTVNTTFQQARSVGSTSGVVECNSLGGVEALIHGYVVDHTGVRAVP